MEYFRTETKAYCPFYNGCEIRTGLPSEKIEGRCEHTINRKLDEQKEGELERMLISKTANECHSFDIKMLGITIPAILHEE